MEKDLQNYRKSYEKGELLETDVPEDPLELFENWLNAAEAHPSVDEVNAMNLSTFELDGFPKNRVVLLKQFDKRGFVFFTNYESDKGKAIEKNPKVCLSFFWPAMERQIIIKGVASKISEEESAAYFHSRPRGSQLGALASNQSRSVASRKVLEDKLHEFEKEYNGQEIPKPKEWGGYLVVPYSYEFWQGRKNRLHDRMLYSRNDNNDWNLDRLAP
ncbi:pyridoxamine 5'-phosphate oxidase [Zunongwangia sp. F363]|uniref:Pyridoxine/pyridoxamine 5'-phosphate oxidase n=1 Tax=Autumnicola tepida TaxID=3075595 RepID=A0ABU3CDJ6_9FLAO|nr:pyridoxamine 5'-phosphate oxidase [Zunongwangia sp. F363]MDT0644381.1 pyridoxamine 5'-phosphate oxidase [Zunongwangia sp. F363]